MDERSLHTALQRCNVQRCAMPWLKLWNVTIRAVAPCTGVQWGCATRSHQMLRQAVYNACAILRYSSLTTTAMEMSSWAEATRLKK